MDSKNLYGCWGSVKIYITKRCNLGCQMCDNWMHHPAQGEELSTIEWKEILLQAREIGYERLVFFGGEPTLRKDLLELTSYARKVGFRWIRVYTHGFNLNYEKIQSLVEAGVNRFSLSLDSPVFHINDKIRGKPGCATHLKLVVDAINTLRTQYTELQTHINSTIQKETFRDLPLLFDLAFEWKINTVTVNPLISKGEFGTLQTIDNAQLSPHEIKVYNDEIAPELLEKSQLYGFGLSEQDVYVFSQASTLKIQEVQKNYPCFIPWTRLIIREDGSVLGCNKVEKKIGTFGNLRTKPLREILDSRTSREFRNKCVSIGKYPKMDGCQNCCHTQSSENEKISKIINFQPFEEPA